jgi:hypothetical protein
VTQKQGQEEGLRRRPPRISHTVDAISFTLVELDRGLNVSNLVPGEADRKNSSMDSVTNAQTQDSYRQ